ncbi:hypothetical protein V2I93_04200 [Pseudomonas viridiflava]|uniref:hypothetical protein n=1 Tax=Pseudomonas viridiflava TaxID=33069 RepID=UPI002EC926B5|nr:hypothetical protein [Pseudomonas viridiflava]
MEDDRALELYAAFRKNYHHPRIPTIVQIRDLSTGRTMPAMTVGVYDHAVSDMLRELSNSTNDFRRWINILAAWAPVYERCDRDEQLCILVETIRPYASLALGAPQALRGRMMFAAATACGHANFALFPTMPDLQWKNSGFLNMKIASRIGQPWTQWRLMAPALSELGHGLIAEETDDYRNQNEHGHPRNIGMGLTSYVAVTDHCGGRAMGLGSKEAISLETVIAVAADQHAVVVKAYEALCGLATEQFEALMVAGGAAKPV